MRGQIKEWWGKLTDDDLEQVSGKTDQMVGLRQDKFVDEPRAAALQPDVLVSEVVEQITQMFANEHSLLGSHWNQSSDVSTEDLRKTLQR